MKYTAQQLLYISLGSVTDVSVSRKWNIIKSLGGIAEFKHFAEYRDAICSEFDVSVFDKLSAVLRTEYTDALIDSMDKCGVRAVCYDDEEYPASLNELADPPLCLYCMGDVSLLKRDGIAIVGTRRITRYGKDTTKLFSQELAAHRIMIISGLASGVDTVALESALAENGSVIAVIGTGTDVYFPAENRALQQLISREGLLVSEYPPGCRGQQYHFPLRNRLIAALSQGVLVTEAGQKSGSLITADYALKLLRTVYVVPGNISSTQSMGSNELLKTQLSAVMVTTPDDILTAFGMHQKTKEEQVMQLDVFEQIVYDALRTEEYHFEELQRLTGFSVQEMNVLLTRMEVFGLIKQLPGNYYGI